MTPIQRSHWFLSPLVLVAVGYFVSHVGSEQPAKSASIKKPADLTKRILERPTKSVLTAAAPAKPENPKVEPGQVKWHGDFATACEASKKSGKPVLLFHMLGKLDDEFC